MKTSSTIAGYLLLLLGLTTGCQRAPKMAEEFTIEVMSTKDCSSDAGVTDANQSVIGYLVRLRSERDEGIPATYRYAALVMEDGSRYVATVDGCAPLLNGPPLRRGQEAEAYLNFPVKPGLTPVRFEYTPDLTHLSSERRAAIELSSKGNP